MFLKMFINIGVSPANFVKLSRTPLMNIRYIFSVNIRLYKDITYVTKSISQFHYFKFQPSNL